MKLSILLSFFCLFFSWVTFSQERTNINCKLQAQKTELSCGLANLQASDIPLAPVSSPLEEKSRAEKHNYRMDWCDSIWSCRYCGQVIFPRQGDIPTEEIEDIIPAVDEKGKTTWVQLYPNPAPVSFRVKSNDGTESVQLTVYDMTGKLILINESFNLERDRINVSAFPNGTYIVLVIINDKFYTEQLVVTR